MGAPGEGGAAEEAVEETGVEGLEDFVEMVVVAGGGGEALAAAGLTDVLGLSGDGFGGDVAAVAVGVGAGYGLFVELGEEDVGDGVMDGVGCGLEEVGEADVEAAFAETDGGVEGGEAAEADVERGNGGSGAEFAVLVLEDGDERGGCGDFFRAGLFGFWRMERCCGWLVEESGRRRGGRRKELQELTQGRGAGMLWCGQVLILVTGCGRGVDPYKDDFIRGWVVGWKSRMLMQLEIQQHVQLQANRRSFH
jgi:hypothetical protein